MSTAAIWWRSHRRRRWRAVVALVLLFGFAAAVPITALAGARRADTAIFRFNQAGRAPDGSIERGGPDEFGGVPEAALAEIAELPLFESTTTVDIVLGRPAGSGLGMSFEFFVFAPRDQNFGRDILTTLRLEGRLPDPHAVNEVAVDHLAAEEFGLQIGDTLVLETWTNTARNAAFSGEDLEPEPDGPTVELSVVGRFDNAQAIVGEFSPPSVVASPAFQATYVGADPDRGTVGNFPGILFFHLAENVSLADVRRELDSIQSRYSGSFAFENSENEEDTHSSAVGSQVRALQLFALASGVAGIVIMGQAMSRHLTSARRSIDLLGVLGATRRARIGVAVLAIAPIAIGGAAVATLAAWLLSSLLPLGLPGRVEPSPGRTLNVAIVVGMAALAALAALSWAAIVGGAMTRRSRPRSIRPSAVSRPMSKLALSNPARLGVRMATERPVGPDAVQVRPALGGAVVGIAGVVGAVVFGASLDHLLRSPELYGWVPDAIVLVGNDADDYANTLESLRNDPRVESVTGQLDMFAMPIDFPTGDFIDGSAIDPATGPPPHTLLRGRFPSLVDEISLGPVLARKWEVEVGDNVGLVGADGEPMNFEVTGIDLQPVDALGFFRERFTISTEAVDDLFVPEEEVGSFSYELAVEFVDGRGGDAVADLRERTDVIEPHRPDAIENLFDVDRFPQLLAVFLALLASGFLAHALISTVRFRRRDIAVLKTVGFKRTEIVRLVSWQATTTIGIGILIGIPLGLIVGRSSFGWLTDSLDVKEEVVVTGMVPATAVAALVIANLIALLPAVHASRTLPAEALREE